MRFGNCWFYAISKWVWEGGVAIICWSPRNVCVAHVMSAEEANVIYSSTGIANSLRSLFCQGGYLVLRWRSHCSALACAGHTHSLAGVKVSEFIPLKPYRGAVGVLRAHFFRGEVRRRTMPGPDDTLTGSRRD